MRSRMAAVCAVLALAVGFLSGRGEATERVTFYLHSLPPSTVLEEAGEFAAATSGPSMDGTAPSGPDAKLAQASTIGNPDFRKNVLLAYWSAPVTGTVSNAEATLWISAPRAAQVDVSLFSGTLPGVASPIGRGSVDVEAGPATRIDVAIPVDDRPVARELSLQVSVTDEDDQQAVGVLYDSVDFPSSVSFDLGPLLPFEPPAWTPQAGFSSVRTVSTTLAHRETSIVIDPTDERRMITCTPSGVPNYPYGQSYFHITTDDGATWRPLYVETGPTDTRRAVLEGGDCDVAFDAAGTMYAADTWLGSLSVGASRDGGETWNGTAIAASSPVVDRPWLVGGPDGTVHVTYQDVQALMPTAIWYTRSTDHARTFRPAVPVAIASLEEPFSWEGNPVVSPDQQHLYLVYTRRSAPTPLNQPETVWIAASHDGGATWSSKPIASMPGRSSFLYPALAMDASGGLHVVYASTRQTDQPVMYQYSADGTAWSDPVAILDGVGAFAPWVAAGAAGEAAVMWLGTHEPLPDLDEPHDWYVWTTRIAGGAVTSVGTTTTTPIFSGIQSETPEFNQVRLDSAGRMRLGTSVYYAGPDGTAWSMLYQTES